MRKTFVIDTNVLLHDPHSFLKFPQNHVVIPLSVLEELDKIRRFPNELGKNSRRVFQLLDGIAKEQKGTFHSGIELENGAILRIILQVKMDIELALAPAVRDHRILLAALFLKEGGNRVVVVSKDFASRVKAEAIGLEAQDYENLKYSYDSLYRGHRYLNVVKRDIDHFLKDSYLFIPHLESRPNEYFIMTSEENSTAVGKYDLLTQKISSLLQLPDLWGIKPLNFEQRCAVDVLLRHEIKLVTLMGPAGTGKTLLALACGMRKVFDEGEYMRILVSRPVIPLGRDIGYLPGTKEEKLFHWMQPIYDNLALLCESTGDSNQTMNCVMQSKKIEMEAVTYIRGRSLPKAFIIVDEAQNLTPHEIKTIISRAGKGTKVVLTGDPTQIDNPYLDRDSNGLTYTVGRFANYRLYGHVFLEKTERSELAALAAEEL